MNGQQWGEHVCRMDSDGRCAAVTMDGETRCVCPCGIRLITDESGVLLCVRWIEA